MVAKLTENGDEIVVMDEASLLVRFHQWIEAGHSVFQHHGDVADQSDVGRTNGFHEFANSEIAELAPLILPERSIALRAALDGEAVLRVQNAPAC